MLQHGAEKSIPLSLIYSEFAAQGFDSKEEFVEHLLARQQEIHELVRRNTHQAELRQKLKFDRHLKAKAHSVGDAVWVFCHIKPKGGTRKLIRAWRGPHKVADVLQEEYGQINIFSLRQSVGTAIRLIHSPVAPLNNQIFLLCTRDSNKHPLLHEALHTCLTYLSHQLHRYRITQIHLPIHDPERSIKLLPTWYATLRDHFAGQKLEIILQDRVYVSIASLTSINIKIN